MTPLGREMCVVCFCWVEWEIRREVGEMFYDDAMRGQAGDGGLLCTGCGIMLNDIRSTTV